LVSAKKIYIVIGSAILLTVALFFTVIYSPLFNRPADYEAAIDSSKFVRIERPIFKYGLKVNGMEV